MKPMKQLTVSFTPEKLEAFKRLYELHKKAAKQEFSFEDRVYVTAYAKYVIEYLEDKFKTKSK